MEEEDVTVIEMINQAGGQTPLHGKGVSILTTSPQMNVNKSWKQLSRN